MNDLDQLKELLFGAEKEALDSIAERVERREVRTTDIADVLPEAVHQSHSRDGELAEALAAPVGQCLQQEFRNDPQTYGDALYPVIGPAIRKSIMHALRNFSQQINEAVEHSISPKGLRWRWQASRAGVPFGEFVLQKTMRYRIEQAYLISRENGLLVGHVHHEASKIKDSDAVSAMFTAIQDFVKESFSPDRTGRLESADMGDFTLWAVHGPHALLVCVIRGVPPKALRADLSAILERIHFRYGEAIREYKGDTSTIPDVEVELERCLRFEARQESEKKGKGLPIAVILMLVLLVAAGAFLGYRDWGFAQQLDELDEAFAATPGVHISEINRSGADFVVRGLRDPLSSSVLDVAESVGVPAQRLSVEMQPFQSLEPEIIERRAAQIFADLDAAKFEVSGATLRVTGDMPWSLRAQLQERFRTLAGVNELDVTGLTSSDRTEFEQRAESLREKAFYFDDGVELLEDYERQLRAHAEDIRKLSDDATAVGYILDIVVHGSTDSSGNVRTNEVLARQRANKATEHLNTAGVRSKISEQIIVPVDGSPSPKDPDERFARVTLQLRQLSSAR